MFRAKPGKEIPSGVQASSTGNPDLETIRSEESESCSSDDPIPSALQCGEGVTYRYFIPFDTVIIWQRKH